MHARRVAVGRTNFNCTTNVSFTIAEFAQLRPFLYHVTARENIPALQQTWKLHPAAELLTACGRSDLLRAHRPDSVAVRIWDQTIGLKDQRPLSAANVRLETG